LQVNLFTDMPANINRSLTRLFDNCAANPTCNQASPDLEAVFYNLVAQLNTNPVTIWPRNPTTGKAVKIRVDGAELINLVFHLLYDTQSIPSLPKMIYSAWNGDYSLLTTMQQRRLARASRRFSHGMYFSVECSEEIAFATPQEIKTSIATYPRLETFFAGIPENTSEIFTFCDTWGIHTPDPVENQPVRSDIPTLILAGEYDPITPPHWGRLAAETLDRSYVYEFSGTGHAVITRGACPQTLIRTFLDDPSHAPDSSCVQ
jgi:pimeloyl-ACP methyl ester carboxylesterase